MGTASPTGFDSNGWPRAALLAPLIAPGAIEMVLHRARWIHRRVEAITLLDEARLRRRISLDLTVPDRVPILPGRVVYLPVALLAQQVLSKFDVRDDDGAALSMLTKRQHDVIAATMVVGMARQALAQAVAHGVLPSGQGDLHPYVTDALQRIVVLPPASNPEDPLEGLKEYGDSTVQAQAHVIDSHREARALVRDLARLFIVFVPLTARPGDRMVLKLAFEESPRAKRGDPARAQDVWGRCHEALLLRPYPLVIAVSGGQSASYHAELELPEDLAIAHAHISRKVGSERIPLPEGGAATDPGHFHPEWLERGDDLELLAGLVLRPSGLLTAAMLIAGGTTAMLVAGCVLHWLGVSVSADAAGAVVVIVPAVFAPFVAVTGTHRLVQRMVRFARLLLVGVTAISFAAAASLVIDFEHGERPVAWVILAGLSLLPTGAFLLAWNHARGVEKTSAPSDT